MRRRGWWIALLLVLVANLVALLGVAGNRSGEPDAVIELTERELPLVRQGNEDSGTAVRLQTGGDLRPDWLDRSKLEELGFDCSAEPNARSAAFHYQKQLPRQGYVVLEYDGEGWQKWLEQQREQLEEQAQKIERGEFVSSTLESQRKYLEQQRLSHSRLFPVDAGRDPSALRERYSAHDRFIIIPAVFRISADRLWTAGTGQAGPARVHGYVSRLLVQRIHVSRDLARQLEPFRQDRTRLHNADPFEAPESFEPRYEVTLKVGGRHEPWIDAIRPLE